MNFNFNMNPQRRLQFMQPFMRNFSNVNLPVTKSVTDLPSKSEFILQNVPSSFLFQVDSKISPQKTFSNPNFVNKHNPNILTPHKIDASSIYQPAQKISPELETIITPEQPKVKKLKTGRRTRKNAAAKRAKQNNLLETEKNMTKRYCFSPKKLKKELKSSKGGKSNKHCKPWHKFNNEMMDYNDTVPPSPQTPNTPESCAPVNAEICPFPLKESSPIEICPLALKSFKQPTESVVIMSPSCEGTLVSISRKEDCLIGVQRIRIVSECESEDSFIVFCDQEDEETTDDDDEDVLSEDTSDVSHADDEVEFQAAKTACVPRERKKVCTN